MRTHETRRRRLSALFLLATFVPMVLLSSLHFHESSSSAQTACNACVSHHCGGHLEQFGGGAVHDCVLCQALSLTFVAAAVATVFVLAQVRPLRRAECILGPILQIRGINGLRAPPLRVK